MEDQKLEDLSPIEADEKLGRKLTEFLTPLGFECRPLLTGWYDDLVGEQFRLNCHKDTLAYVVLSQPSMFEKSFLPYLRQNGEKLLSRNLDPLDSCMLDTIAGVKSVLGVTDENEIEILHDFQLNPGRRPKVLVQTAAHVAGAVRFFKLENVQDQPSLKAEIKSPKVYPVCVHPKFGGWFAIRAVIILKKISCSKLQKEDSNKVVELSDSDIRELLKLYNDHWNVRPKKISALVRISHGKSSVDSGIDCRKSQRERTRTRFTMHVRSREDL